MKLTLQHDAMLCGIACLSMVFNHYGKDYSIEFLEQYAQADAEGMSLLGLAQAAEKLGLHAVCGRSNIATLKSAPLPAILHWRQNHYVVLDKISRGGKRFRVFDPGIGIVNYSREEFLDGWISTKNGGEEKGVVMLLSPTQKFYENTTTNTENNGEKRSFKFLLNYLKQYKKQFIFIFFALTIGSLIQLALPFFMQAVVDKGIKNQSVDLIWLILIGQLVLTFSATVIDFIRQRILLKISMEINISLISDFFIKLLKPASGLHIE